MIIIKLLLLLLLAVVVVVVVAEVVLLVEVAIVEVVIEQTLLHGSRNHVSLRKHAYSNILNILPPKNENFQIKKF